MSELSLPIEWAFTLLGDVAEIVSGMGFPKHLQGKAEGEIPVFKVGNISSAWKKGESALVKSPNNLSMEEAIEIKGKIHPQGTIVFAKIGEALRLNRRAMLGQPSLVDNNVMGLVPKAQIVERKYLFYFMTTVDLGELSRATAVPSIRKSDVQNIQFPLAPLDQQKRIVAEIEKQFSRLDEAVANLKRVKANLKRYKAAVLKAAVEGKLTEEWRKQHPDVEPADKLLERILEERRVNWQGRGKYKEPAAPDTTGLSRLPERWVWAKYEQVGRMQLGRQRAPKYHTGLNMRPYLRVANVFEDRIDLSDVKEMDFPPSDLEKYELVPGDLLLNEGQSPEFLGRPAIYRGELPGSCFTNTLIRFRAVDGVSVEFALIVSRHNMREGRFVEEGTITTNIAHLSLGRLATVEFPLPSEEEQERIVNEVERQLSIIDGAEVQIDIDLRCADRLRQSILKKAFNGEL